MWVCLKMEDTHKWPLYIIGTTIMCVFFPRISQRKMGIPPINIIWIVGNLRIERDSRSFIFEPAQGRRRWVEHQRYAGWTRTGNRPPQCVGEHPCLVVPSSSTPSSPRMRTIINDFWWTSRLVRWSARISGEAQPCANRRQANDTCRGNLMTSPLIYVPSGNLT